MKAATAVPHSYLQRKCACGGKSESGPCPECQKRTANRASSFQALAGAHQTSTSSNRTVPASEPGFAHDFSRVRVHDAGEISNVHRSIIQRAPATTGQTGSTPCTPTEVNETNTQAEAGRKAGLASVSNAVMALNTIATPALLCAFASNFNTPGTDPSFGTRRLTVLRYLTALQGHMRSTVPYACKPSDDPVCTQATTVGGKTADTVAYVSDHRPPINFCPIFRGPDVGFQKAIVTHEFAHLVPNIDDSGGYAFGGLGADTSDPDCKTGAKFKAAGDVLIHTADALTGFVMNMENAPSHATPAGQAGTGASGSGQTGTPGSTPP
jgi:hypothetical protein